MSEPMLDVCIDIFAVNIYMFYYYDLWTPKPPVLMSNRMEWYVVLFFFFSLFVETLEQNVQNAVGEYQPQIGCDEQGNRYLCVTFTYICMYVDFCADALIDHYGEINANMSHFYKFGKWSCLPYSLLLQFRYNNCS